LGELAFEHRLLVRAWRDGAQLAHDRTDQGGIVVSQFRTGYQVFDRYGGGRGLGPRKSQRVANGVCGRSINVGGGLGGVLLATMARLAASATTVAKIVRRFIGMTTRRLRQPLQHE
jgi:hypothetical protein